MSNPKSLIPNSQRTPEQLREMARAGGIASVKARREKKNRFERMKAVLEVVVNDPKTLQKLQEAGVDTSTGITYEEAAEAMQALKAARDGDTSAFRAIKEEAYGKLDTKAQLEVSGEISGITINVKNYSKKGEQNAI